MSDDLMSDDPVSGEYDSDLRSVQEARRLALACRSAQREFASASQADDGCRSCGRYACRAPTR